MGEVIGLRARRKLKARAEKERRAEENRAAHGRSKADRARDQALKAQAETRLDGHRRDPGER